MARKIEGRKKLRKNDISKRNDSYEKLGLNIKISQNANFLRKFGKNYDLNGEEFHYFVFFPRKHDRIS